MNLFLLVLATIGFSIAGYFHSVVRFDLKARFPSIMHDDLTARFAVDSYVWDKSVPNVVRQKHLLSLGSGSAGLFMLALLVGRNEAGMAAWIFGLLSACGFASVLWCLVRHGSIIRTPAG